MDASRESRETKGRKFTELTMSALQDWRLIVGKEVDELNL